MSNSRFHIVVRVVLALGVCLLTWLCIHQAVDIEHLKRDLTHVLLGSSISLDPPKSYIPRFLWQHLFVLPLFAVCIAFATLLYLFVSKVQHRAVMISAVALVILLIQMLVVAPAATAPAVQLYEKLQIFQLHNEGHAA